MEFLRENEHIGKIGLWGRSMGAATAILYAAGDPSLAGLVLDSPFSRLREMALDLARSNFKMPMSLSNIVLDHIRKTIQEKIGMDINTLNPIDSASLCFTPAVFIVSEDDEMIPREHADELYDAYTGEKQRYFVAGTHNTYREDDIVDKVCVFWSRVLDPPPIFIDKQSPSLGFWENTDDDILSKVLEESARMEAEET
jgi:fermentation-respiration switch protein FrsA (DUF1100 family)